MSAYDSLTTLYAHNRFAVWTRITSGSSLLQIAPSTRTPSPLGGSDAKSGRWFEIAIVTASKSKRIVAPLVSQSVHRRVLFALNVGQYEYAVPHDSPPAVFASVTRRIVVPNVGSTNV